MILSIIIIKNGWIMIRDIKVPKVNWSSVTEPSKLQDLVMERWPGKPGVLQSMGLQRVRHGWATELNWTELYSWSERWVFKTRSVETQQKVTYLRCTVGKLWRNWAVKPFLNQHGELTSQVQDCAQAPCSSFLMPLLSHLPPGPGSPLFSFLAQ